MSRVSILEGLRHMHIDEAVSKNVLDDIKVFFKKYKVPSGSKKKINNILNKIYQECNNLGNNEIMGGMFDYTKGEVGDSGDAENGPNPYAYPSIREYKFQIRFDNPKLDFSKIYSNLVKTIKSSMKSDYKNFTEDPYSADFSVDSDFESVEGNFVSISKNSRGLIISIISYGDPVYEGKVSRVNSGVDIENSNYIGLRSDYSEEDPEGGEEESGSSEEEEEDSKEAEESGKPFESKALGTEVDLPIDKENCESTGIDGVSTPSAPVSSKEDLEGITIVCPECGSDRVNIRNSSLFHCSKCGYEWVDKNEDGVEDINDVDGMLDNSKDKRPERGNAYRTVEVNTIDGSNRAFENASSSEIRNIILKAISKVGVIQFNWDSKVEIAVSGDPKASVVARMLEKEIKKSKGIDVSRQGTKIFVDGGDYHTADIEVYSKIGESNILIVYYNIIA